MATVPDFGALAQQQKNYADQAAFQTNAANRPNQSTQFGTVTWGANPDGTWQQSTNLNPWTTDIFNQTYTGTQNLMNQVNQGAPQASFGAQQNVIDAWNALQQPGLDKAGAAARNRAAAMGITIGSTANNDIERTIGTNEATSRNQGILQGVNAYSDLYKNQLAGYNASRGALGDLTAVRNSLNPNAWATKVPTSVNYTPTNAYGAAGDTFAAQISNENIDAMKRGQNIQGASGLLGAAGGIGGIASGVGNLWSGLSSGIGSAWDWASNMWRTNGASGNNNYIMPEDWEAQNY